MVDPAQALLGEIESDLRKLVGAKLAGPAAADAGRRIEKAVHRRPPPGLLGFLAVHDGGDLDAETHLLSVDEGHRRHREIAKETGLKGLWPIVTRDGRVFALDAEAAPAVGVGETPEWPVVEVMGRSVDRAGTTFLRFLHALCADVAARPGDEARGLAQELCARDPGHADHWLELAEIEIEAGRDEEAERALASGMRLATPPGPALLVGRALFSLRRGQTEDARRALDDALALEPLTARDDDARLDAAALVFLLASEAKDAAGAVAARRILGEAGPATAAFWRGQAVREMGHGAAVGPGADLALRLVLALLPDDQDVPRLRTAAVAARAGLQTLVAARDALDAGKPDEAKRKAMAAVAALPDLGLAHAMLAEVLNAQRDRGAEAAARRASELNPALVDGWRELGDARLEQGDARGADEAFRKVVALDPAYGLGHAKLAQALLERGRPVEALDAIQAAEERGGDPFFVAAIRGDVYADMERHGEAAEAYDQALRIDPEDHWALHQAAVEHGAAGNDGRAAQLFEEALLHDAEGCPQTFFDYAELLRRVGRIGDAVRLYRRAVAAVPGEPNWRQSLKDAEKELRSAPN